MDDEKGAVPDPEWGELELFEAPRPIVVGRWSMLLEPAGITAISFAGRELVAKLFFSVRDLAWGTPVLRMSYRDGLLGEVGFSGEVTGTGISVSGTVRADHERVVVDYAVTARRDITITRIGPAMLHELAAFGSGFRCDQSAGERFVATPQRIRIERVASGYQQLEFEYEGVSATIRFDGDSFEMEDQRNWGDATLKTYCPPLGGPLIELEAGSTRSYRVSIEAHETDAPAETTSAATVGATGTLPVLGLAHSGGALSAAAVEALRELCVGYLHLLVELGDRDWRERLENDLGAAGQLGVDSVLSVDVPANELAALEGLAAQCAGRVSVAFVFDTGQSTTSDELASSAARAFAGSGIAVGGGSRSHFASLTSAGRVADAVTEVAIPLAVAAHDNDRRTLAESPDSFSAIIREARLLVGERNILVGPVGFRPTFDPWLPQGSQRDLRSDWMAAHPRDGSVFAAAWMMAALGALAESGVGRVTIAATLGGRGVLRVDGSAGTGRPTFEALRSATGFADQAVRRLTPRARLAGFGTAERALLGDMTDGGPGVLSDNLQA